MERMITIDERFHGPPDSGNGGYVCGLIAKTLPGDATVTLRQPPPLNKPLRLTVENDTTQLFDGAQLIGYGEPTQVDMSIPEPPSLAEAQTAVSRYVGFENHVFPSCFVCGPEREAGDGLHIFAGQVDGRDLVAAPWQLHESLMGSDGRVQPEFIWSALDCPGAFSILTHTLTVIVLGKLSAHIAYRPQLDETCVVIGWQIGQDGRKYEAGTAVFTESGKLCGAGKATWIELKK